MYARRRACPGTRRRMATPAPGATAAPSSDEQHANDEPLAKRYGIAFLVFIFSGLLEIGGGWLVWQTLRAHKPFWYAILGSVALVGYGFVATLNPLIDFGRVYALYGGIFVIMSIIWGRVADGFIPDTGDYLGLAFVLVGVLVMTLYPRVAV